MSTLKVNTIRHTGGSADNITLDNSQNVTVEGNLTVDGTLTAAQRSNRNLIINGAMNIAQRGTSVTDDGCQTVDRFRLAYGGSDNHLTQAQHALTSSDTGPWAKGFRNSYHITNGNQTSGAGASDYTQILYRVEAQDVANSGWDYTSASSYVTVSFWIKASVAQTYYCNLETQDGTGQLYSFSTGALSANTWTKVTKTIPGHSNITINNDNGTGLVLIINSFLGTTFTTSGHTPNQWAAAGSFADMAPDMTSTWWTTDDATFEITGVQLEVGSVATDFEHRSYGDELAKCQRYYWVLVKGINKYFAPAWAYTATNILCPIMFAQTMRATPALVMTKVDGYFTVYMNNTGDTEGENWNWTYSTNQSGSLQDDSGDYNLLQGGAGAIYTSNAACVVAFDAEL